MTYFMLVTGKMELQEMLLDILSAGEAKELGPDVYQQFCIRDTMKRIFRIHPPSYHPKGVELMN